MNLVGMRPHRIAERGIARTFQNVELFRDVPVLDNVLMGRHIHLAEDFQELPVLQPFRASAGDWGAAQGRGDPRAMNLGRIAMTGREPAYGKQKLVEIARALAMEPTLLLLDEPTSGMTMTRSKQWRMSCSRSSRSMKVTQVLIEHDVKFVSDLCDRIVVLDSATSGRRDRQRVFSRSRKSSPPTSERKSDVRAYVAAGIGNAVSRDSSSARSRIPAPRGYARAAIRRVARVDVGPEIEESAAAFGLGLMELGFAKGDRVALDGSIRHCRHSLPVSGSRAPGVCRWSFCADERPMDQVRRGQLEATRIRGLRRRPAGSVHRRRLHGYQQRGDRGPPRRQGWLAPRSPGPLVGRASGTRSRTPEGPGGRMETSVAAAKLDDVCAIHYTSGTTGQPKARFCHIATSCVRTSHRSATALADCDLWGRAIR